MTDPTQSQAPTGATISTGVNVTNQPPPQNQTTQALPEGVTFGTAPVEQDTPVTPDGVTFGDPVASDTHVGPDGKPQSTLTMQDSDSLGTKIGKGVAGAFSGIGEGLFSTAAGAADLLNNSGTGQLPSVVTDYLHKLAGDNEDKANWEKAGYGGETLAEFFMGDAALKALPMAKRLEMAAKTMKVVEGSPRIMQALKIGAGVMTQAALHAGEAGLVQAGQTYVRSGGDTGEAAQEGAGTGAVTGVLDAGLGGLGEVAKATGATAKAAEVFQNLSAKAKAAIDEQGVFSNIAKSIQASRERIANIFDTAQSDATAARASADTTKTNDLASHEQDIAQGREQVANQYEAGSAKAQGIHQAATTAADAGLEEANHAVNNGFIASLQQAAQGGEPAEKSVKLVSDAIDTANDAKSERFEEGINGENGIATQLAGWKMPYEGSASSKAAQDVLGKPNPKDDPITAKAKKLAGLTISSEVRDLLQELADGGQTLEPEEAGAGPKPQLQPTATFVPAPDRDIEQLIRQRQAFRAAAAKTSFFDPKGAPTRYALGQVIEGIDDDILALAKQAGKPELVDKYQALRQDYKESIQALGTNTARKLSDGLEKELADPIKYLTSGVNGPGRLNALTSGAHPIIAPEALQGLAKARIAQLAEGAADNPEQFIKDWNSPAKTPQWVKDRFYGPDLTKQIDDAITVFEDGKTTAQQMYEERIANRDLANTVQNYDLDTAKAEGSQTLDEQDAETRQAIKDQHDLANAAIDNRLALAEAAKNDALKPHETALLRQLAQGRVSDSLKAGTVDLQDILNIKQAVGDDWNQIADGLFQRGIAEANGSPEDTLKWWDSMNPDVRREMFNTDSSATANAYNDTINELQHSLAVKQLIRNGLLVGAHTAAAVPGAIVGAVAGAGLPAAMHALTPLAALIGGIVTSAGSQTPLAKGVVAKLVNYVADHPNTWKVLRAVGNSKVTKAIGKVAPGIASHSGQIAKTGQVARQVYNSTASSLSGNP